MTKQEFHTLFGGLDKDDREEVLQFAKQTLRARALGLALHFDQNTGFFFIADATTNCVIAPPPMNIETVTAWLDDYEQEATTE